jgi:hypothetical protein
VSSGGDDLLRDLTKEKVREVRQIKESRLGERRGAWVHRRRRNQAKMLADAADSDGKICRSGDVSRGEEKRGEGRGLRAFIGGVVLQRALGFRGESRSDGRGENRERPGIWPEVGED